MAGSERFANSSHGVFRLLVISHVVFYPRRGLYHHMCGHGINLNGCGGERAQLGAKRVNKSQTLDISSASKTKFT